MYHIYADDGRILTSPNELEPQLNGSFSAFSKLIGHIRFFYMVDELWDGASSLVFHAEDQQLAAITLGNGEFNVQVASEHFHIVDDTLLDTIFDLLKNAASPKHHRPLDQLTINENDPNEFHCGFRCDCCLGSKKFNENDFSGSEKFDVMNWVCYHNCVPNVDIERNVHNKSVCPGCDAKKKDCKHYTCPTGKGYRNCVECGEYHSCEVYQGCHYPGQCNLGLTAEEITNLVIPYNMIERLDVYRNSLL